jgi:hypothetical protein
VLVTLDLDFANVQAHPVGTHAGIIVFRSKTQDKLTLLSLESHRSCVEAPFAGKANCGLCSRTASDIENRKSAACAKSRKIEEGFLARCTGSE